MDLRGELQRGLVIPAHPLALTAERKWDERRQRALTRYYLAAGAGGIAVGVHTTQFEIRDAQVGLLAPVLQLAAEEMRGRKVVKIAGVCGATGQAVNEAELAASLGFDAALLSLGFLRDATNEQLIDHARNVAAVIPVIGFYLQPSVGGRVLDYDFWTRFVAIDNVAAIKIAPFNRYQSLDVIRAVAQSGRVQDIALYTGNDDNIVIDLLGKFEVGGEPVRIVGGLLGQWAVWTSRAVEHLKQLAALRESGQAIPLHWLTLAHQVTDANAAIFDPANGFRGCIPGIHEILRRQGLLAGRWCVNPDEDLSPGQMLEIDRVCRLYPHLTDDAFVEAHRDEWLK
jgi:hypothetical protein